MKKDFRLPVVGLLLLVTGAAIVAAYIWLQSPQGGSRVLLGDEQAESMVVGAACNAAADPCSASLGAKQIRLSLGPGVKPLQPFAVKLDIEQWQGAPVKTVIIRFDMQAMDMGLNRYSLQPVEGSRHWGGTALLPVCTANRNDWLATVTLHSDDGVYRAVFPFLSQ